MAFYMEGSEEGQKLAKTVIDSVTAADIQQVAQTVFDPTQLTTLIYK